MNSKMYLPAACLIFCAVFVLVVQTEPLPRLVMAIAACIFLLLLIRAWRKGR